MPTAPLPQVSFANRAAWSAWLDQHHADSGGVWLKIAKQASGIPSVTYLEALEIALCYGWIDGQKQKLDAEHWVQKFTPRKANSLWSRVNRLKALALIGGGLMRPAGHAAIERARANGRWEAAYDAQSVATVPPDLQAALDERPEAATFFANLDRANRYAILFRLQTARKPETRADRLRKFIAMLERHEKLH